MKKTVLLLSFLSLVLFSFIKKNDNSSPEVLAKTIFETIKNNKEKQFLELLIKNEELTKTIDASDMDKESAKEFKAQIIQKLNADRDKITKKMKEGFAKIQADISNKSCKNEIKLGSITPKFTPLRNLPLELGELNFQYICSKDTQNVYVKVINTIKGWRVLEKIRIVN